MAGIGMESPLMDAKNQIFLGSDPFIAEAMQHADCTGIVIDIPKAQKLAARPTLVGIFQNENRTSKKLRNLRIKEAFEKHQYTLREIGQHLQLHPDYLSRLMHEMRKTSEGRT